MQPTRVGNTVHEWTVCMRGTIKIRVRVAANQTEVALEVHSFRRCIQAVLRTS